MDENYLKKIEPKIVPFAVGISIPFLFLTVLLLVTNLGNIIPPQIPLIADIISLVLYYFGFVRWVSNKTIPNDVILEHFDLGFDILHNDNISTQTAVYELHQDLINAGLIPQIEGVEELLWIEELVDAAERYCTDEIQSLVRNIRNDISREDIFASTMRMREVSRRMLRNILERAGIEVKHFEFMTLSHEAREVAGLSLEEMSYIRSFWSLSNLIAHESHGISFDLAIVALEDAARIITRIIIRNYSGS